MDTPAVALPQVASPSDSLGGEHLLYSNERGGPFRYTPERLTLTLPVAAVHAQHPTANQARLVLPDGWRLTIGEATQAVGGQESFTWIVLPGGRPASCHQSLAWELLAGDTLLGTIEHPIAIEVRGRSQLDPQRDGPPFRNSSADLGAIEPRRDLFDRTYRPGGMILPGAFFRGLYRDIVFLAAGADERGGGGLCTGMARFTLQCSLEGVQPSATRSREEVQVWHGRQLTDAALLAAAAQFFAPSPAAAFWCFRDQVLDEGRATVAFDIGIARWDPAPRTYGATLRRLVTQGHTVVLFAFRQTDDDTAEVQVYDPSHTGPEDQPQNVMCFDLARDRYAYRGFGSLAQDDHTTVLAVAQAPFARPGTAYLASLVNLTLHPQEARQEVWGKMVVRRQQLALAGGALALLLLLVRRRASVAA
jgi:hypothetical protein